MPELPKTSEEHPASAREMLATNLVGARSKRGLSQESLALKAGLHRTFITHVEQQRRSISLDNLEKIARALDLPIHSLLVPFASFPSLATGEASKPP